MLAMFAPMLLQEGTDAGSLVGLFVALAFFVIFLTAVWKVYTKAGHPGWVMLIPIYNAYVMIKIVGRPGYWLLLSLIPIVNLVIGIIICFDLAKSFGKGTGFGMGLLFLGPIFYMILGLGDAEYVGPSAA